MNNLKEKLSKIHIPINIYYFCILVYLEFIFKVFCTNHTFNFTIIYILLFIIPLSTILTLLSTFYKNKTNSLITKILILIITLWYTTCSIFKLKMGVFFSINSLGLANQLTSFLTDTFQTIFNNFFIIILLFIPFILTIIFNKKINYSKTNYKKIIIYLIIITSSITIFHLSMIINKDKEYSTYKLYNEINNHSLTVEKLGINISSYLEIKRKIFGFNYNNKFIYTNNESPVINETEKTKYNITNIDFDTLTENTKNTTLVSMNEYFKNDPGTNQNKYTGFYKGKNSSLDSVGIGLSLAKRIIEEDNGYISCDSIINEGTTFTIKYMK